ncbi:MAG: class I SAM-dependent methyltransferase [Pseudonocardiaceae bacterium]
MAQHCNARLIGVDRSGVAITDAQTWRHLFPDVPAARFMTVDVTDTGLPEACADMVISIDVLQLVHDPTAMLAEAARLVTQGGPVVLSTWEGHGMAPRRFPRDLTTLTRSAGLDVESVTEHPAWLHRQLDIYERAVAADTGEDPAITDLADEGRRWQAWQGSVRRVMVTAHRPR